MTDARQAHPKEVDGPAENPVEQSGSTPPSSASADAEPNAVGGAPPVLPILEQLAKARRATKPVPVGDVKVAVTRSGAAAKWRFDRHGSYLARWFEREADKGNQYFSVDLDVHSAERSPRLPALFLCSITEAGDAIDCASLRLEFYRWEDYGTYLGNYHDSGNDFAKRDKVRFTAGVQLPASKLKGPHVLVAKPNCATRRYERFSRPPESYESSCSPPTALGELVELVVIDTISQAKVRKIVTKRLAEAKEAGE